METATKTIASFEALTPELFAPQGTLETDLGLPASLNAQFSDGVAGEIPVTWQCAAGYDPNAAAGGQFAFAAVLPEGYALLEGVSLPQILVTLTPPLANAMLAAESDEDWTLSDGKLTVTGYVGSDDISSFASAQSIEICEGAQLILQSDFSGTITVLRLGTLENDKTLSGAITVSEDGYFYNDGTISGGTISGDVSNYGTITDGDFTGATVTNTKDGTISGGTFTGATVYHDDGTITGYRMRCDQTKLTTVRALHSCGFETIASGDSFNDQGMIQASKAGFLFRSTEQIKADYPQIPAYEEFGDLLAAIRSAMD